MDAIDKLLIEPALVGIDDEWRTFFKETDLLIALRETFSNICRDKAIFDALSTLCPAPSDVLAFARFPISRMKIAILGQDPYMKLDQAHGLAFSVRDRKYSRIPPSLKNIVNAFVHQGIITREDTANITGNLTSWCDQGVLLLNTALTTEIGKSRAHIEHWANFTRILITNLCKVRPNLIFILFGSQAQKWKTQMTGNCVLVWGHPSPLNQANKDEASETHFIHCTCFKEANNILQRRGVTPINWGSICSRVDDRSKEKSAMLVAPAMETKVAQTAPATEAKVAQVSEAKVAQTAPVTEAKVALATKTKVAQVVPATETKVAQATEAKVAQAARDFARESFPRMLSESRAMELFAACDFHHPRHIKREAIEYTDTLFDPSASPRIVCFVDGAARRNGKVDAIGGYAAIIMYGMVRITVSGTLRPGDNRIQPTNNRAELMAMYDAFLLISSDEMIRELSEDSTDPLPLEIVYDSKYAAESFWKCDERFFVCREIKCNADIIKPGYAHARKVEFLRKIKWTHVKSHTKCAGNEEDMFKWEGNRQVDAIARECTQE